MKFNVLELFLYKETIGKSDLSPLFTPEKEEEAKSEIANLRLQAIASLPNPAVFSDKAHHTYGQSLDTELKPEPSSLVILYTKSSKYAVRVRPGKHGRGTADLSPNY